MSEVQAANCGGDPADTRSSPSVHLRFSKARSAWSVEKRACVEVAYWRSFLGERSTVVGRCCSPFADAVPAARGVSVDEHELAVAVLVDASKVELLLARIPCGRYRCRAGCFLLGGREKWDGQTSYEGARGVSGVRNPGHQGAPEMSSARFAVDARTSHRSSSAKSVQALMRWRTSSDT